MDADEEEEEALVSASRYPVCDFPEDWSPLPLEGEEGKEEGGDEEVHEPEEGRMIHTSEESMFDGRLLCSCRFLCSCLTGTTSRTLVWLQL